MSEADLLLHVIDASDPEHEHQIQSVETILRELGLADTPRMLVFNKCDRLDGGVDGLAAAAMIRARDGVSISAVTKAGFDRLLARAEERLWREGKVQAPRATRSMATPKTHG